MATYIMLTTLTDEGRKTIKERPNRIKEVNKELEGMGAKVISPPAIDRDFKTIDWLVMLDVRTIDPATYRFFFRDLSEP